MVDYRSVAVAFGVLTVAFAGTAGYFALTPTTVTQVSTTTSVVTSTVSATSSSTSFSVNIAYKQGVGFYLQNSSGWTLYLRKSDTQSPLASTCTGGCINTWPAFYSANVVVPPQLNSSGFTVVSRADGVKQLSYQGWPLYYYVKDLKPGDTNGQGVGNTWFVCCNLPAVTTTTSTTSTTGTPAPAGVKASIASGTSVNQASPGYAPSTITVVRGVNATVAWTNSDSVVHTITSVTVPTGAQSFDSGDLKAGGTFSYTFTVAGTYTFHCDYHTWMKGTVIVK